MLFNWTHSNLLDYYCQLANYHPWILIHVYYIEMLYFPKWYFNVKCLLWLYFLPFDILANILKCTFYMWIKNVIQKFVVFMTKILSFILVQLSLWQKFLETHFCRYIMKCISLQCVFTFDISSASDLTFDIFVTLDSTYFIRGNVQSKKCRLH